MYASMALTEHTALHATMSLTRDCVKHVSMISLANIAVSSADECWLKDVM